MELNKLAESESLDVTFLSSHEARTDANFNHSRAPEQIYITSYIAACSLGRTPGSNQYTCYRHMQGSFDYLKNLHALALYSGTIGALLENNVQNWDHPTLLAETSWLRCNNNFFKTYNHFYNKGNIDGPPLVFPTARILSATENNIDTIQNNLQPTDIIISNTNFNSDIYKYSIHINDIIGNYLPSVNEHESPYESIAIDYMSNTQMTPTETDKLFCHYTNFPTKIILKEGMRVIFLNNSLFTKGLSNGSIGVVLKVINNDTIQVAFPLKVGIAN
ncbi:9902_t:CDS:2 [Diversispora eburnea]|uniref:9902_t:CDS:1 n=1 Tax=Diversispora eburnea TaxID=1213867 RepID=A0A9N9C710_9GLOM|nr:9902_t:CDS:2 [Diversispora eburnea]